METRLSRIIGARKMSICRITRKKHFDLRYIGQCFFYLCTFTHLLLLYILSCLSGSESTNSMEECITAMKLVFLSIFTPMDRQKRFTRMERWPLNSRDRKIENVIIEVKYQRVLIGIDNHVESCKLVGRGNYC